MGWVGFGFNSNIHAGLDDRVLIRRACNARPTHANRTIQMLFEDRRVLPILI